jgi:polysaccharide export outer membrane protein/exopolysaccharide production protein ExoF
MAGNRLYFNVIAGRFLATGFRCGTVALLALVALVAGLPPAAAFEAEYRVGPQDKLKIKVSEWRAASRELFEWAALSGEFSVNSTGLLSMPVVGTFSVENRTTAEIGAIISERLKSTAGLIAGPAAAVEVAQYRPIYVVGVVEKPGEYAYRPGMSALQAVSIAGGFYRAETSMGRFERETIIAEGEIKVNETQFFALLLRRDRLQAEARKAATLTFSDDVARYADERLAEQGMREERALFVSRRVAVQSQLELLQQSKSLLEDELKTLAAKSVTQRKQNDLVRRELDNINSLLSKGLAVSPRQLAVEQNLAQIESQALDLMLATARAKQEIGRIDRNIADAQNQRETDINRELRETQVTLKQTADRINSLRMLVYDSNMTGPRLQAQQARESARVRFSIVRRQDGALRELAVEETSPVLPGDIVKIERATLQAVMSDLSAAEGPTRPSPSSAVQN